MGDLIIKPASSGNLKIQDQGGTERISLNTSGITTFASNTTFSGTGNNIGTATAGTLGSSVVFPAGHIISFATGTYTRSSGLSIGTSDYHLTDLSCDLVTTSTSNKIVVQYIIPDIWNKNGSGNAVHMGVRYNVGTGAFDNSAAQTLGARSYSASYQGYQSGNYSSELTTSVVMVTATVPTVNTLRLYPIFKGVTSGVSAFDNSGNTDYDEASIIAYEIKQ